MKSKGIYYYYKTGIWIYITQSIAITNQILLNQECVWFLRIAFVQVCVCVWQAISNKM